MHNNCIPETNNNTKEKKSNGNRVLPFYYLTHSALATYLSVSPHKPYVYSLVPQIKVPLSLSLSICEFFPSFLVSFVNLFPSFPVLESIVIYFASSSSNSYCICKTHFSFSFLVNFLCLYMQVLAKKVDQYG